MRRLCVFCGSSAGAESAYAASTAQLGTTLAERGLDLVYGGGGIGLMGVIADAVIAGGGNVIGVIPHALEQRELAHRGVADMRVVTTMHERKALMAELADAFVALPGGIGTLEEFFEVWTWAQLGVHRKPCGLLNAAGYFDPLLELIDHMVDTGFLRPQHRAMVFVEPTPEALLDRLADYTPPDTNRWLDEAAT
ncbi:MAG: TIGR00730 family Rossman fold protein [Planctomycetales bacterium]|nr:TIGR00730 family Rossman fold protein [Planctomycetales bacterium]